MTEEEMNRLSKLARKYKLAYNTMKYFDPVCLLEVHGDDGEYTVLNLQELPDSGPRTTRFIWKDNATGEVNLSVAFECHHYYELQVVDSLLVVRVPTERIHFHLDKQIAETPLAHHTDPFELKFDPNNVTRENMEPLARLLIT